MRPQRRTRRPPPVRRSPEETQKMDSSTVQSLIQQGMPEAKVEVHGPDGVHFEALVVSPAFAGKLPLARHRMVYATLGDLMGGAIHALSLRTLTPEEAGLRAEG
jgi:acid stress-induced BolA-like protein IbaG/YrbA